MRREKSYFNTLNQAQRDQKLLDAAEGGQLRRLEILLQAGANPDAEDQDGCTALQRAVYNGYEDCAELLLDNGADINTEAPRASDSNLRLLLSRRAKINTIGDLSGSALHTSSRYGNTAVVELLLSKGAEINMVNVDGLTALMLAASYGNTAVIELLLSKGAEIDVVSMNGWTALTLAANYGNTAVVELLLSKGAEISVVDVDGWTALMLAASHGNTAVIERLLSKGAEINVVNVDGWTALMITASYGNTAVIELLLSKGAEINVADMGGLTALMLKNKKGKIALDLVKNLEISIMLRKHLSTENQSNSPVSYPLENPNASPKIHSLLTTSHVETQSKVPLGYKAIWNDKYEEWFYVNIYTKESTWEQPTKPVYPPEPFD
ncbi:MAG: hypothetical protein MMC33_000675 [Icmadophila ericetorum]|nr:hypothetical protein [Icmadophila ericetorum]